MLRKRTWLNTEENGGTAFVCIKADDVENYGDDNRSWDGSFMISDCNRVVTLEFYVYLSDPPGIENARIKARRLYAAAKQMRDIVLAACDEVEGK